MTPTFDLLPMKQLLALFVSLSFFAAGPLAQKGELLFTDDFERSELGEWKTVIPSFAVQNGVLKGWPCQSCAM